jgi:hypothetical protein
MDRVRDSAARDSGGSLMTKKSKSPELEVIRELRERLGHFRELLPGLSPSAARKAAIELLGVVNELDVARADLDPIKEPGASFDPSDTETAGRLVALALVAQERVPLARIARTYGSGVYAIYYHGDHAAYAALSGTETPIYIGKADPQDPSARTPRAQGPQLYRRLDDHRRMINTVGDYAEKNNLPHPLRLSDFTARRLVCATNAQLLAEKHLIRMFRPIWNNEVGICWGISKHGDSATTRSNKRSPWDVLHPGRPWAMHEKLEDKMSAEVIVERIRSHFEANPPHRQRSRIVREFLLAFVQNAAMTPEQAEDDVEGAEPVAAADGTDAE